MTIFPYNSFKFYYHEQDQNLLKGFLNSNHPPARQISSVSTTTVWNTTLVPSNQVLVLRVWPGSTGLENLT